MVGQFISKIMFRYPKQVFGNSITEPSSENIFQHVSQSFSEDCPGVEPLTHFRR